MKKLPDFVIYGLVMAGALFFVGFITGMGGSLVPNFLFSVAMGALAGAAYGGLRWYFRRKQAGGK